MSAIASIFIFVLGSIIGSFLNVVILRFESGKITGRSKCPKCKYQLKWFDLIPIFSWIFLRGKCRKCGQKISPQYPLVELGTGLLFLALLQYISPYFIYPNFATILFLLNIVIFSILIVIFVYDLYHKIIPDRLSYGFAIIALINTLIFSVINDGFSQNLLLDILAGPIFFVPFWALWFLSKGTWIGLGDGKLAIGIGWYLGFVHGISAIVLAFWIGAVIGILILLIDKLNKGKHHITMRYEVPFAPFLIIGLLIEFFFRLDVIGLNLLLI